MPDPRPVLVTRVAISMKPYPRPTPEWIEYRLGLLDLIGIPAWVRAGCPPWIWLAHPAHMQQIHEHLRDCGLLPDITLATDIFRPWLPTPPSPRREFRVDSDDAYHPDIFAPSPYDYDFHDYPVGYQLDITAPAPRFQIIDLRLRANSSQGPFLSTLNPRPDNRIDVYGKVHEEMRRGHVRTIETPAWLQVVHGSNALNKWRTGPEVVTVPQFRGNWEEMLFEEFGIDAEGLHIYHTENALKEESA